LSGSLQQYECGNGKIYISVAKSSTPDLNLSQDGKGSISRDLLIIYHMSLPLKYEFNTRCYITRQHGWKENTQRRAFVLQHHASIFEGFPEPAEIATEVLMHAYVKKVKLSRYTP
jgi:hypothetical protein